MPHGMVTTLGGHFLSRSEREFSFGRIGRDGIGKEARFDSPSGIAVDDKGVLYITDSEEHVIRKGVPVRKLGTYLNIAQYSLTDGG